MVPISTSAGTLRPRKGLMSQKPLKCSSFCTKPMKMGGEPPTNCCQTEKCSHSLLLERRCCCVVLLFSLNIKGWTSLEPSSHLFHNHSQPCHLCSLSMPEQATPCHTKWQQTSRRPKQQGQNLSAALPKCQHPMSQLTSALSRLLKLTPTGLRGECDFA